MIPFKEKEKYTELLSAGVVDMKEYKTETRTKKANSKRHVTETKYTYAPVYEYHYNGNDYRVTSLFAAGTPKYSVGQNVTLQIDPESPGNIYEEPASNTVMGSIIMKIVGAVLGAVGIVMLIVKIFVNRQPKIPTLKTPYDK